MLPTPPAKDPASDSFDIKEPMPVQTIDPESQEPEAAFTSLFGLPSLFGRRLAQAAPEAPELLPAQDGLRARTVGKLRKLLARF
jgi:hypothetical protein